jgi:hypothetical protein
LNLLASGLLKCFAFQRQYNLFHHQTMTMITFNRVILTLIFVIETTTDDYYYFSNKRESAVCVTLEEAVKRGDS